MRNPDKGEHPFAIHSLDLCLGGQGTITDYIRFKFVAPRENEYSFYIYPGGTEKSQETENFLVMPHESLHLDAARELRDFLDYVLSIAKEEK